MSMFQRVVLWSMVLSFSPVSLSSQTAYVALLAEDRIVSVDLLSENVLDNFAVGDSPRLGVVSLVYDRLYSANYFDRNVSVTDLQTGDIITTIATSWRPSDLVLSPDQSRLYVSSGDGASSVQTIDLETNTVIRTYSTATDAVDLEINPSGSRLYVSCIDDDEVTIIDLNEEMVVASLYAGDTPRRLAVDPDDELLYVANTTLEGVVSVLDLSAQMLLTEIVVSNRPQDIVISEDGTKVYVSGFSPGGLTVIDVQTQTVEAFVEFGQNLTNLIVNPTNGNLVLSDQVSNVLYQVDASSVEVVGSLPLGGSPTGIFISSQPVVSNVARVSIDQVDVFPNPTRGMIELPVAAPLRVDLFDVSGELIHSYPSPNGYLDISEQVAGQYFLRILTDNGAFTAEVVKVN